MYNLDHISDCTLAGYFYLSTHPPEALHCPSTCSAVAHLNFYIGNVKFIDERISWSHWQYLKHMTAWDTVLILTLLDGRVIGQQFALLCFVGKKTCLYQRDIFLAAKAHDLMYFAEVINPLTLAASWGIEMSEKESAKKAACEEGGLI